MLGRVRGRMGESRETGRSGRSTTALKRFVPLGPCGGGLCFDCEFGAAGGECCGYVNRASIPRMVDARRCTDQGGEMSNKGHRPTGPSAPDHPESDDALVPDLTARLKEAGFGGRRAHTERTSARALPPPDEPQPSPADHTKLQLAPRVPALLLPGRLAKSLAPPPAERLLPVAGAVDVNDDSRRLGDLGPNDELALRLPASWQQKSLPAPPRRRRRWQWSERSTAAFLGFAAGIVIIVPIIIVLSNNADVTGPQGVARQQVAAVDGIERTSPLTTGTVIETRKVPVQIVRSSQVAMPRLAPVTAVEQPRTQKPWHRRLRRA